MKFSTTIIDISSHEWTFKCEVEGRGLYDSDGNHGGFVVQDFKLVDIVLERTGIKMMVKDFDYMPPQFLRNDLNEVECHAEEKLLQEWMELQEDAYDASYETFVSQNLSK